MDLNLGNHNSDENNVRMKAPTKVTKRGHDNNSNKCNQCDYASPRAGHLREHMKTHSGEKSNKCSPCTMQK